MRTRSGKLPWILAGVVWLVAVVAGFGVLMHDKSKPAAAAEAPELWPADSRIPRVLGRATLVMMAHPRCPCTRAAVSELGEVMAAVADRVSAHVLVVKPAGTNDDFDQTDIVTSARRIPGVSVFRDEAGRESALFRAKTSGQVVLYGANGQLLFRGGITATRGHPGDNAGRQRIISLMTRGSADSDQSLVFGCALGEDE